MQYDIGDFLGGGDRRSIARVNELVPLIGDQAGFDEIFARISSDDPLIAMRAADAAEKLAKKDPGLLALHKDEVLKSMTLVQLPELQWHYALMSSYLDLDEKELAPLINTLQAWMTGSDNIFVKVHCMQALADIAIRHKWLIPELEIQIGVEMNRGSAAVRARARKLLEQLKETKQDPERR